MENEATLMHTTVTKIDFAIICHKENTIKYHEVHILYTPFYKLPDLEIISKK
jgi:hypothetical protein